MKLTRIVPLALAGLAVIVVIPAVSRQAQLPAPPGTIILGVPREPTLPLPIFAVSTQDADVSDQLFLRLGTLGSSFNPSGDRALDPMLAEKWQRVNPLTLQFTLHPKARWQDGTPVTSHDFVYTWKLLNDSTVNPDRGNFEAIAAIEEVNSRSFRVRFKRPFQEQLYLIGFAFQPLPAHLLEKLPPESIARSPFARRPIGNGPYRFERQVPGEFVELRADSTFFRGRPGINRVIFKVVADPQGRINQLLAGDIDVIDNLLVAQAEQIRGHADVRTVSFASNLLLYALFNTRSAVDTARPSAALADRRVRDALTLALDRQGMARTVFGEGAQTPDAARSQAWGWVGPVPPAARQLERARTLLAEAGWRDVGPDGVRRQNGQPLKLTAIYLPASSSRTAFAIQAQQMWKEAGVAVTLDPVEPTSWNNRRHAGTWDIEFGGANQDASPMSLTQSWSCMASHDGRSSNIARWCDAEFDRLVAAAVVAPVPATAWRTAFDRMASERPAVFLAAPMNQIALHTRFAGVIVWPVRAWLSLWQWRVRPEAAIARDR